MAKIDTSVLIATGLGAAMLSVAMLFAVKYRYANTLSSEGIVWWQSKAFTLLYRTAFLSGLLVAGCAAAYWIIDIIRRR